MDMCKTCAHVINMSTITDGRDGAVGQAVAWAIRPHHAPRRRDAEDDNALSYAELVGIGLWVGFWIRLGIGLRLGRRFRFLCRKLRDSVPEPV